MKYLFYPGCSLTGSAREYADSARAVMTALGEPLPEMQDWNCCGASATSVVDPDLTLALNGRNLALAEAEKADVVAACACCYTNLRRAREIITGNTQAGARVRAVLAETGRRVTGASQVRHLLEIMLHDMGLERIKSAVKRPLKGLKVAAYYGCQLGRPKGAMDHPETPRTLDDLIGALGAQPVEWGGRTKCCGAATIMTKEDAAFELVDEILTRAEAAGAQVIATACPMCQLNLDAYQTRINRARGRSHRMPVLFFTQLMGIALGTDPKALGLDKGFVSPAAALQPFLEGVAQ